MRPAARQFETDAMEEPVRRAAPAVPPTASMTSEAVVKSVPGLNERIGMPAKIVHAAFIMQQVSPRLWPTAPDFETIKPMGKKVESAESTSAVAERLRLTREAFGMKKAAWCRFVGITPQAWSNVEGTESTPATNRISLDQALLVCKATGVGLDWIYRGHRDNVPHKIAIALQKIESASKRAAS